MNVIQFDNTISLEVLQAFFSKIKEEHPDIECIVVPKGIDFMADIGAETLFSFMDNIAVALEKIKQERPEEYKAAYNNRMIMVRDQQWKEAIKKQNKLLKKKTTMEVKR